ncbi:MAG: zf-HC2 domain-containing protein [Ignavibacteriales bacterium]|nr:zf-HC2 domain-containing protein [Ignavibacteriales bacterium]
MKQSKRSIQPISCEEALSRVFDFIDDHLRGKARIELEHHLETCRHCFDRVEFERLLKSRLRKLNVNVHSQKVRKRVETLLDQF